MKKLQRGDAPNCLRRFSHGVDTWKDVTQDNKEEIWGELIAMQGMRCAYCECDLELSDRHIEHFVQKGRFPQVTFDWHNLFGSCCIENTCGLRKDIVGFYDHSLVIKPDIEDPDRILLFVSDGTIQILSGLCEADQQRGETTLSVFGLHHKNGQLRNMRRLATEGYVQTAEVIAEFAESDPENACGWREELAAELRKISELPFSTAIRHLFKSYVDC